MNVEQATAAPGEKRQVVPPLVGVALFVLADYYNIDPDEIQELVSQEAGRQSQARLSGRG